MGREEWSVSVKEWRRKKEKKEGKGGQLDPHHLYLTHPLRKPALRWVDRSMFPMSSPTQTLLHNRHIFGLAHGGNRKESKGIEANVRGQSYIGVGVGWGNNVWAEQGKGGQRWAEVGRSECKV